MSAQQCKYCNRPVKHTQILKNEIICYTCYEKRKTVRKLIKLLEPLKKQYEQRFIEGIEFSIDNNLPVPESDLKRYYDLIERRKNNDR